MRDIALTLIVLSALPFVLKRPLYGMLLYTWLSVMSPHRLTFGFAYDQPWAMGVALVTFAGILLTKDPKRLPLNSITITLAFFVLWMNLSTLFAVDQASSMIQLNKVMKILLMVFVAMYLMHTKEHVQWLIWIVAGSVAFYGVKGGIFTLTGGGMERVYGPGGSFIEENNSLALAVIMTIPLLRYIQLQMTKVWMRWALIGAQVLCGFSALGSLSRGALVAIAAMLLFLWLKSRKKLKMGALFALVIPFAVAFMSDRWEARMWTIQSYEEDASAQGRLNAWTMAFNLAKDRPLTGGGFEVSIPETFARYAPNPADVKAAHSIYFSVLGEHGFVGLFLFLLLWYLTWRNASWIKSKVQGREKWQWADDLASMIQVSLVGYATGGAFLSLAYYDVPYNLVAALVATRILVEKEIKENPAQPARGMRAPATRAGPAADPSYANRPVPATRRPAGQTGR